MATGGRGTAASARSSSFTDLARFFASKYHQSYFFFLRLSLLEDSDSLELDDLFLFYSLNFLNDFKAYLCVFGFGHKLLLHPNKSTCDLLHRSSCIFSRQPALWRFARSTMSKIQSSR